MWFTTNLLTCQIPSFVGDKPSAKTTQVAGAKRPISGLFDLARFDYASSMSWKATLIGVILFLPLLGTRCLYQRLRSPIVKDTRTIERAASRWSVATDSIDTLELTFGSSTQARIVIYKVDPTAFTWQWKHDPQPHTIAEWAFLFPNATLIANGVYFHKDFLPSGFFEANGTRIGDRSFDQNRSGMIVFDPTPRITSSPTNEEAFLDKKIDVAQTYPFLIQNGTLAFKEETGKLGRRTFFGVDREGASYIGIVPDEEISLYNLARTLIASPVAWKDVLNLDGGPSTGLILRSSTSTKIVNSYTLVPNVLMLTRKTP